MAGGSAHRVGDERQHVGQDLLVLRDVRLHVVGPAVEALAAVHRQLAQLLGEGVEVAQLAGANAVPDGL